MFGPRRSQWRYAEHSPPCLCLTIGICLPPFCCLSGFIHRLAPVVCENAFVVQGECSLWAPLAVRVDACAACTAGCRCCCCSLFVRHPPVGPALPCLLLLEPSRHGRPAHASLSLLPSLAGNRPEELPEQILASARVYRVDFTKAMNFPAKSLEELGNGTGPAHDGVADR